MKSLKGNTQHEGKLDKHVQQPQHENEAPCGITSHVTVLLLFIGYPRSGHTLVSSLLDAHPHMAVANEYKLLQRWKNFTEEQKTRKHVFGQLYRDSVMQSQTGFRSATVRRTFNYSIPNQWNGRCHNFLQVVGDKHGPMTTKFLQDEEGMAWLDDVQAKLNVSIRLLHVLRNPLDNIATMTVRTEYDRRFIIKERVMNSSTRLETQARVYLGLAKINNNLLVQNHFHILNVYSEDLIARPKHVLSRICRFLSVRCSSSYLSSCTSIISTKASTTRNNVVWTDTVKNHVNASIYTYKFLNRYRKEFSRGI